MTECKYCFDDMCVNDECPLCTDFCPVPDVPDMCKWEDRGEENE
jgi:hypothetical protein